MAHKLEIDWFRLGLAGRHPEAYRAFLERQCAPSGLKGLYEFASEPIRAKTALPMLLRYMAGGPIVDGEDEEQWRDNFRLSRGLAFQMRYAPVNDHGLLRETLVEMAKKLWASRLQVWGDPPHLQRSLPYLVDLFKEQLNGEDTEWTGEKHGGPLDNCGFDSCETLWVRADTGGKVFEASFGPKLDVQWAETVRQRILTTFAEAARGVVNAKISDEGDDEDSEDRITRENVRAVSEELASCLELCDPLDLHEAWCRQQVVWVARHASFRIQAMRAEYPGVTDIRPMDDGTLSAVTWRAFPLPERSELIDTLWPEGARTSVSETFPTSLEASEWAPYLMAWCRQAMDLIMRSDPRPVEWLRSAVSAPAGVRPGVVIDVDHHVFRKGVAHPRAAEWIEDYAKASGLLIRYHEGLPERTIPSMDAKTVSTIMSAFVEHLGDLTTEELDGKPYFDGKWPNDQTAFLVPEWQDGRAVSLEQAIFGDEGMRLVNNVDDWPENLPTTFGDPHYTFGGGSEHKGRGPANMLRRGLGTWINRAFSERGQRLLYQVLTERSPAAVTRHQAIGPMLTSLSSNDALGIAQLMACDATRDLWGHEFSWNIAFALGGSSHSAIEVRSALQERMRFTNISEEMPAWTLRGPSELSFIQFANELAVGARKFGDRKAERGVIGAYVWSKELRVDTGEPVPFGTRLERGESTLDVAIALVGWDRFEGKPTDIEPKHGWSSGFFKQFRWAGLDPDMSMISMIEKLSSSLEEARQDESESPNLQKSETYDADNLERMRHDREAFLLTMKELSKVLLYMQMREARMERDDKAYGDNVGRGEHPLLPPRNKDSRFVRGGETPREVVLHRIRVGPIKFDDEFESTDRGEGTSGYKVAPHPRMGHIRHQAVGPGWRDHKPIWIKPQWIGMKSSSGVPRLYDVG